MSEFSNNKSYICYTETDTRRMNIIDETFRNAALSLGGVEYHIPAMINHDILEKCGYFSKFPQHLTVAAHANPSQYKTISESNKMDNSTAIISNQYFTPAACLHIYPMLEGHTINQKVITTKARVYRYENENFNGTTRLWDFTVREIVFVGTTDFVINCLDRFKSVAMNFAKTIGLPAEICAATDNFYPNRMNSVTQKIQLSNALKFELGVHINNEFVALSSFNYHNTHFSKTFKFDGNNTIVTGCVGFGLERWIEAINYYQIDL